MQSNTELSDRIFKYVNQYWDTWQVPMKYRIIASAYNRVATRLNVDLRDLVKSDTRLFVHPTKQGGLLVMPQTALPKGEQKLFFEAHGLEIR